MQDYYFFLLKPTWAPPAWLFGPVWTVLYVIILVTFGWVFYQVARKTWPKGIAIPFALNVASNIAFTPIQFGLRNNLLATVDIFFVLGTLVWAMVMVWPRAKWIAVANVPYLLWVLFATVLQVTITLMNV